MKFGEEKHTCRGFEYVEFLDGYGETASLQISSAAVCEEEDGTVKTPLGWLWLGLDDVKPLIMKRDAERLGIELPAGEVSGWMDYPVPECVQLNGRMHLDEQQVRGLISYLERWLKTGRLHKK